MKNFLSIIFFIDKKVFYSFLLVLLFTPAVAKECNLDKSLFYTLLLTEGLKNKAGYEYIISFNKNKDSNVIRKDKYMKSLFVDNRTLDCKNKELCSYILFELTKNKIINLDLGAFQINYNNELETLSNYFDIDKSYKFACKKLKECFKQFGYTWKGFACYHSKTPKYNRKYMKLLKKNFDIVMSVLNSQKQN